jgi:acyl-CoA thioesterase-1
VTVTDVTGRSAVSWCLVLAIGAAVCGACRPRDTVDASRPVSASRVDTGSRPRIVVLGDSLTAGLGLRPGEAYPAILEQQLQDRGHGFDVVNAGVSGDTSAGGLRRLDWALEGDVRILVVALGANDGLRGVPVEEMKRNLGRIIEGARRRGVAVLLAGMEAPPNYGEEYRRRFRAVYPELATKHGATLVPFLLDGVAGDAGLNQPDGIHPTAKGQERVAENVWKALRPLL